MKSNVEPALITFLDDRRQGVVFDLWTILLQSGTQVQWTDADGTLTTLGTPPRSFTRGPIIQRDRVRWTRGIEVAQLQVDLHGPTTLIDGQALPVFATKGGFDSAAIQLERAYLNDSNVMQGSIVWFMGAVSDVNPTDMGAELTVKSQLSQLNQQIPRSLYQPGCLNNLYDANCGVSKAARTVSGTVSTVVDATSFTNSISGSRANGYFNLGILRFTSGANAGIQRTVLQHVTNTLYFPRAFPFAVQAGDAFTLVPGCDKTQSTCFGIFSNLLRFRGMPYVPVPETVT